MRKTISMILLVLVVFLNLQGLARVEKTSIGQILISPKGLLDQQTKVTSETRSSIISRIKPESFPSLSMASSQYEEHSPILISSNDDFISQGFSGSGTIDDPYQIEGYNITASSGQLIHISGTTVYFSIANNYINGLTTATYGIYLVSVQHATVINNTVCNFYNDGIHLEFAPFSTVTNNTCIYCDEGIRLIDCSSSNVTNNTCNNNRGVAISLESSSSSIIANNTCSDNNHGIGISFSDSSIVTENICSNTNDSGLWIGYLTNCQVYWNKFSDNRDYGVKLHSSATNNIIHYNIFINNSPTQAYDEGSGNTFENNYWDEWTSPDGDGDCIVDTPYDIGGTSGNQDHQPLTVPELIYYTQYTPISINSNADFLTQATVEGWSGNGTAVNPIIIENYWIRNSTVNQIDIRNTDLYFVITHCLLNELTQSYYGIYLNNVENGHIGYNKIIHSYTGVFIESTNNTVVVGNDVKRCASTGIKTSNSDDLLIAENTVHDNDEHGIYISSTAYSEISGNEINYNGNSGITVTDSSHHIDVLDNVVYDNYGFDRYGIVITGYSQFVEVSSNDISGGDLVILNSNYDLVFNNSVHDTDNHGLNIMGNHLIILNNSIDNIPWNGILLESFNTTVIGNNITNCGYDGIMIISSYLCYIASNTIENVGFYTNPPENGIFITSYSQDNILEHNLIFRSAGYGIHFDSTTYDNNVSNCDFVANNPGYSQAADDGTGNIFYSNFWNDWRYPDVEPDGIVDNPYSIDGSSSSTDPVPRVNPVYPDRIPAHELTSPEVTYPNGGEIVSGTITIQWIASTDSWDHPITYNVSYSGNNGFSWIPLTAGLLENTCSWDTTTVPYGIDYWIKVVATCSDGTVAEDTSDNAFTVDNSGPTGDFLQYEWSFDDYLEEWNGSYYNKMVIECHFQIIVESNYHWELDISWNGIHWTATYDDYVVPDPASIWFDFWANNLISSGFGGGQFKLERLTVYKQPENVVALDIYNIGNTGYYSAEAFGGTTISTTTSTTFITSTSDISITTTTNIVFSTPGFTVLLTLFAIPLIVVIKRKKRC